MAYLALSGRIRAHQGAAEMDQRIGQRPGGVDIAVLMAIIGMLGLFGAAGFGKLSESSPRFAESQSSRASQAAPGDAGSNTDAPGQQTASREGDRAAPRVEREGDLLISYSGRQTPSEISDVHRVLIADLAGVGVYAGGADEDAAWHKLDLDGDGGDEYLVFLTMNHGQSGDDAGRYLIVYRQMGGAWRAGPAQIIARKSDGEAPADRITFRDRVLSLVKLVFGEGDAPCCPSRARELSFDIAGDATPVARQVAQGQASQGQLDTN
jgi:hypothetical protein